MTAATPAALPATRLRKTTLMLTGALLATALTGCGEGPGEADEVFAEAAQGLRQAGSGSFTFVIQAGGEELVRTEGAWESDPDRSRWTVVTTDGEMTTTEAVAADGEHVLHLTDSQPDNCWIRNEQPEEGAQVLPGSVLLAMESRATGWAEEGTVVDAVGPAHGLVEAMGDLGGGVVMPPGKTVEVAYRASLDDGRIIALRSDVGTVLRAVRDAGGTVPERLEPFLTEEAEIPLLGGFSAQGEAVDVAPPRGSQVDDCDD